MNNKYLTIIIAIVIFVIILSGCVNQTKPTISIGSDTTSENSATLHATIIDKITGEPIENAIVYLGADGSSGKCYSDNQGKCSIKINAFGDYGVGIFKKGYNRYSNGTHFEKGDNYIAIKLEKKSEIPISLIIEGKVIEIVSNKGSRSENHIYKIRDNAGNEEFLFNEIGVNQGFEKFINKKVIITGFKEKGFIGWEYKQVEGIYVESIE